MRAAASVLICALLLSALAQDARQRLALRSVGVPQPTRQIAYTMRVFHQAAIRAVIAAGGIAGAVIPALPVWLTDQRFAACANGKTVATYTVGLSQSENQALAPEALRQSVSPPELGTVAVSDSVVGAGGPAPLAAYARGIGQSNGATLSTPSGAVMPPCVIPEDAVAIVTQAVP
jgi:hypothetical protein